MTTVLSLLGFLAIKGIAKTRSSFGAMTSLVELKELMDECGLDTAQLKLGGGQRLL